MSTNSYRQQEMEINLKEVIWDLLEQWKAILITALIMALLVCGAKYAKDTRTIEAEMQKKAEAEKQADAPAEERIAALLDVLSDEDATVAMNMATQYEWLDSQKAYLRESILINTDPTQQRVLKMTYYISGTEQNASAISSAYRNYIVSSDFTAELKKLIAPNAEDKYGAELIQAYYENEDNEEDIYPNVLNVSIIMLDDTDADAVAQLVSKKLSEQTKILSDKFTSHKLQQTFSEEATIYNYDGATRKTETINRINNLQKAVSEAEGKLSDEQRNAANAIYAIKKESINQEESADGAVVEEEEASETVAHFSKKYALLGFILGVMAYVFVYIVLLIVKGRINYATDAENYTGTRLVGEIYSEAEGKHKGIGALMHSKLVDKYRYSGKVDEEKQIQKLLDTLNAACKHEGIKEVTILKMAELSEDVVKGIEKMECKTNVLEIGDEFRESDMLNINNVVYAIGRKTKIDTVSKISGLCTDYDVKTVGCVFAD